MLDGWSQEELFRWFILQQQQLVMIHLGKMVHPGVGEITRDLDAAKLSIDLLGMLETKTKGNLSGEEERLLGQVLTTLRLNYLEESVRPAPEPSAQAADPGASASSGEAGASGAVGSSESS